MSPLQKAQTYSVQDFGTVFGKLRFPIHVFEHNLDGYTFNDVVVNYRYSPEDVLYDEKLEPVAVRFTNGLARHRDAYVEQKRQSVKPGTPFFNGPGVGLRGFGTEERSHLFKKLVLDTRPSFFFDYVAVHHYLDKPIFDGKTIRELYEINPYSWNNVDGKSEYTVLPNHIGSEWVVISEPEQKLIAIQRPETLAQYPGRYGVSPAGFIMRKVLIKDPNSPGGVKEIPADVIDGVPNPFRTAIREGQQEMGISFSLDQIKLYALARPWDDLHPELIGEIRTNMTVDEIRSSIPKGSKYEILRLMDIPFDPESVIKGYHPKNYPGLVDYKDFDFSHPTGSWVPAQALAVLFSTIREFGEEKVRQVVNELQ